MASPHQSIRGLEWLNFFVANVQTGFGPFISAYLTSRVWPQADIGIVLTISSIVALAGQFPAGVIVDAMRSKRLAASLAVVAIAVSALILAAWPAFPLVVLAELLHGLASCLLGPAIAAITIGLVEPPMFGRQFGRNASFASFGAGIAAALMGACGRFFSNQAVFVLTAILVVPALIALRRIAERDIDPLRARGEADGRPNRPAMRLADLIGNRNLLIFSGCLMLFHLANAAMLPLVASLVTMHAKQRAPLLIAACIVVPQIVVALLSPWLGRKSQDWGRKPLLVLGFAALPIRGVLLSITGSPYLFVLVQVLDGVSAAVIGVIMPIVVADVTRRTAHFNAALGAVGTAAGIGATISPTIAGYATDMFGGGAAFAMLAAIAVIGALAIWRAMPETRPPADEPA
jgi:MFS family permease